MQHPPLARRRLRRALAVAAVVTTATAACVPQTPTERPNIRVLGSGLNGPNGLTASGDRIYVAETDVGQITKINPRTGAKTAMATGLLSPTSVDVVDGGLVFVTGGAQVPDASMTGDSTLFTLSPGGAPVPLADLEQYELDNNPDGQLQFDPETNEPLDALSNPFSVLGQRGPGLALVADAGANAVLSVAVDGEISTFFVPPLVTTGACEGQPNNDPEHAGCDPVPTGLAYGPDNSLYVSTLSAEAPGEGRVYVLDATTAEVRRVITGLDAPTGVAVSPDGTVFVSEVLFGAPAGEGPPPEGFDPASVGRIVRIDRLGQRATAAVTMPTGLRWSKGRLLASTWAIAGFFGLEDVGQVVAVRQSAFVEE